MTTLVCSAALLSASWARKQPGVVVGNGSVLLFFACKECGVL
jgi:hypothetical protein